MLVTYWILGKQGGTVWNGFIWLRIGTSGRSCVYRNLYQAWGETESPGTAVMTDEYVALVER